VYLLGLSHDGTDPSNDIVSIAQITSGERSDALGMGNRFEVLIECIYKRHSGWYVELGNVIGRNVVQMLDESPESVAVRGDEKGFAGSDLGRNGIVPVGDKALLGELEGFGARKLIRVDVLVNGVVSREVGAGFLDGGRGDVVAPSPQQHLLLPVLFHGFLFVQALQGTVVPFVEAPRVYNRDVLRPA